MLVASGKSEVALTLCREIASRAPEARWAHRRAGYLLAAAERFEEGVAAFQTALKTDVLDAAAWEGLASCYQSLGRFTAALKAYGRALELQPGRAYARMQSGTIHMALGSFSEVAAQFEAALGIAPRHPAAQLGAAESLAAAAAAHARQGALGTAADELAQAAGHVLACTTQHGTLQAAWKLLGDVLALHHAVSPAPHHPTIPPPPATAPTVAADEVQAELGAWQRRVAAMRQARRAYAKALHLGPNQAGAWQDAAFAASLEAQLLRAHPGVAASAAADGTQEQGSVAGLVAAAERMLRAGLRLDPASPDLWAALGTVAAQAGTREYCLSRALQLDPKCVPAWVALARLYAEHDAAGPAASALQQARSHEPAVPAIWEAMADVAALSATGAAERAAYQEHAHLLGAGPQGLLGYAQSSIQAGRALEGPVYSAALKAAHMQPLNPAALNVLGLASEARGDFPSAISAYRRALQLLVVGRDPDAALRHPPTIPGTSTSLQTAVQLNLARALTLGGAAAQAVQLYEELEATAELYDQPPAWLAYAAGKRGVGDPAGAAAALHSLQEPGTPAPLLAAATRATLQLHCEAGVPAQALQHLQQQLPALHAARVVQQDMERLWGAALAAAAASEDAQLLQQAVSAARAWAAEADADSAAFLAQLHSLQAAGSLAAGHPGQAAVQYSSAVHISPTSGSHRLGLAAAVLMRPAGPGPEGREAEAALRLLQAPAVAAAVAGSRKLPVRVPPAGKGPTEAALECGTRASLAAPHIDAQQLKTCLSAAARAVHECPSTPRLWYLGAMAAKQAAAVDGSASSGLRAQRWCRAAERLLGRGAIEVH